MIPVSIYENEINFLENWKQICQQKFNKQLNILVQRGFFFFFLLNLKMEERYLVTCIHMIKECFPDFESLSST